MVTFPGQISGKTKSKLSSIYVVGVIQENLVYVKIALYIYIYI